MNGQRNKKKSVMNTISIIKSEKKELFIKDKTPFADSETFDMTVVEGSLRKISDAIPHLVWLADETGNTLYMNQRWEAWNGMTIADFNNGKLLDYIHPDDMDVVDQVLVAFRDNQPHTCKFRMCNDSGIYHWFVERCVPITDDRGTIANWISTFTDINDIMQIEQQKDEFMSVVTHELKTPLTSMKVFTQVLQRRFEKSGDDASALLLSKMEAQVNRLQLLISDLLDKTILETGKMEFITQPCEIDKIIEQVVEEIGRVNTTHKIRIKSKANAWIKCDADRLGQVMINLLTNAIKYSPQGSDIIIRAVSNTNQVIVSVQDFGSGIKQSLHDKIFDKFYRAPGNLNETFPGMGLGLYISREFVTQQGGELWVESTPGHGSTFYFRFPILPATVTK